MKAVILGQRGGWHTESLRRALAARGIEAGTYQVTHLTASVNGSPRLAVDGVALDQCDVVFVRAIPAGSLEQVVYRMDALRRLEQGGVRVVNSAWAIEHGVDKYYAAAVLQDGGVPTPRTVVSERVDDALAAFEGLGGDVVVKPLFGSEGRGMVRVSDADTAYRVFRALELGRYVYLVQEFVPHGNEDIRALVVGDRVVAAMRRRGATWKTNAAQGATGEAVVPDAQLVELSVRAARLVGAEHAGVDLLPCGDGSLSVVEVNTIPGWRALEAATGADVAGCLVDHVLEGAPWTTA
jgi:RimK family alpha-L-glutamate ligase